MGYLFIPWLLITMTKKYRNVYLHFVWAFILYTCKTSEPVTKIRSLREIEYGDTLNITWNIERADSIVFENNYSHLDGTGSLTLIPDTTTTYTFYVYRKDEVKKKRITVEVKKPKAVYISIPDSVNDEETVTLKYRFENVNHVKILHFADSLFPSGDYQMNLDTTSIITLLGYGKHDSVVVQKLVKVGFVEDILCPGFIYRGQKAEISWKFKNNREVQVEGFERSFLSKDTLEVMPDKTIKYQIYAIRDNGDIDTFQHQIMVKSPYISSLSAPNCVKAGDSFTIKWSTVGASFALLNNDTVPSSGSKIITLQGSAQYTLTIYDGKIPVMKSVNVHKLDQRAFVTSVDPSYSHKPGQRIDVDIIAVEQSDYPKEIKLHVVMVDTSGNYISNAAPPYSTPQYTKNFFGTLVEQTMGKSYAKDFKVKEVRHDTSEFYDISMVLDHSGSMCGEIEMLQKGSKVFMKNKFPKDRISVVKFDNNVVTMTPLEFDFTKAIERAQFNGLDSFGGLTALYAGADQGIINLNNAKNEKVLILFTDGFENSSFQYFGKLSISASQVANKLRARGIRLFIISYGSNVNQELLSRMALLSGGKHYNILRKEDLLAVFEELPRIFRHYYEISYKPQPGDGNHHIRLTYKNQIGDLLYVETDYVIGDDWSLDEDRTPNDSTYTSIIPPDKKIIVNTQTVATFDFDKDTLKMRYYPAITNYVDYLAKNPTAEALIIGHTDSKGSKQYCYDLSLRRAKSVRDFLINKGVDKDRLKVKGCGKDNLIWEDDTEEWKGWENRRVEVLIYE
ncbi:MAG: OmpA family protein [Bacteroidales bacterium]|nr:OmpA family protein [Bacteroidales bacterium]